MSGLVVVTVAIVVLLSTCQYAVAGTIAEAYKARAAYHDKHNCTLVRCWAL
jgi:hypothetical protein